MMHKLKKIWNKRPLFNGVMLLEKKSRYWGHVSVYYDGMHHAFGFWWFTVGWQRADWS